VWNSDNGLGTYLNICNDPEVEVAFALPAACASVHYLCHPGGTGKMPAEPLNLKKAVFSKS